jgi:hypothetical protein
MYLEVAGFEKDFEVRFESLQKKFRSGQAGADVKDGTFQCFFRAVVARLTLLLVSLSLACEFDFAEVQYQVRSRWSNEEQQYVKVLVPIKKDSPKNAGSNTSGGSSGNEVGGSLLGWASKLIAFSVEATGMDHPLSPSAFKRAFKSAERELVQAKVEQKAYRALLLQLEEDAKEWRTQETADATGKSADGTEDKYGLHHEEEV